MADILKPAFRATSGLDAAGEKVINVAKADFGTLSDGVNVDFFIEENTLQQYDTTRGYRQNFAVIQSNRIWVSNRVIAKPAGAFKPEFWTAVRTDPKWRLLTQPLEQLNSGDYVTVNSNDGACTMKLPASPQDGDTIVIKDIGGNSGYNQIRLDATNQKIVRFGEQLANTLITKPYSYNIVIFSRSEWQFYETAQEERGLRVTEADGDRKVSAGDIVLRRYTGTGPVTLVLPKYANQGDIIRSVDMDGKGPRFHLIVKTVDNTYGIDDIAVQSKEFRTSGDGFFTYNAADKVWKVWDGDMKTRLRVVTENTKLEPNTSITVFGENNVVEQTIILDLPTKVAVGDTIKIALNYLRKKQTVKLVAATGDKIMTEIKLLQFPKRSEYPPDAEWVSVDSLEFNGDVNYTPVIEFSYYEKGGKNYWVVAQNVPTVERVDSKDLNTRKRLGVISLASQDEANADYEQTPYKEAAITPETLANRTARETRRGITRIATRAQATANVAPTDENNDIDNVIMTPFKMDMRTATTDRKGVAETATQAETDAGTLTTHIVTPKTLNDRKAREDLTGILALTGTGATTTPGTARGVTGSNVYNMAENTKAVTPKSLFENKATATSQGGVYLAIQTEVNNGVSQTGYPNAVVTPETLGRRRATDTNHGLIEIATQAETDAGTDYDRAVTPKTLNDRKAREDLSGIAEIATQIEFDTGTDDTRISTPLKVKTRFNDTARTSVVTDSGLVETGTLWDHYKLDVKEAKEDQRGTLKLASQRQTDDGLDDMTAVTPLKLHKKKATENAEGIIQVATQAEVVTGVVGNKAVPPKHLKYIVQDEKTWEASPDLRGFVRISKENITWIGDDTNGSVANVDTFIKSGYAISPYELNKTLTHYLPIKGKAFDSDKLDGLDSTQFIRRDADQLVEGKLTLSKETTLTAPLTSSSSATFTGDVTVGNLSSAGVLSLGSSTVWKINAKNGETSLKFGPDLANPILTLNNSGNANLKGNMSLVDVSASGKYSLKGKDIIESTGTVLSVGEIGQDTVIRTKDASNLSVRDSGSSYKVLTEKNAKEIVDRNFVKKEGDTMGGKLTIESSVLPRVSEVAATSPLTTATTGFWISDIVTAAVYEKLPGYAIPKFALNEQGNPYVESYTFQVAPGLMTCTAISATNVFRTWTPRPVVVKENENALTQYISVWDVARNEWGEWGRVLTSQLPPTPSDIGAVASSGSAFNNLKIRDWLQIGNVRIEPDQDTRTVKFTWIDNP